MYILYIKNIFNVICDIKIFVFFVVFERERGRFIWLIKY